MILAQREVGVNQRVEHHVRMTNKKECAVSTFLSLDLVWLDGSPMTSAGEVNMAAALTKEPALDGEGNPYYITHTWPSVMLLTRPDVPIDERVESARFLISEMGMMPAPRRAKSSSCESDARAALMARWRRG